MNFMNIKRGDTVVFYKFDINGKSTIHKARVNPLLIFPTHVVVNHGNNGTVITETNFCGIDTGE
jgi:hypothetical protein